MTKYISQLNGKEQNAIFCIKKLIALRVQPLGIYCFGCQATVHTKRSAFITRQFQEERHFTCDLLVITSDETAIDDAMKTEIQEMVAHFGKVNMIIHPVGFVIQQLNEGNLFFNWVCKYGMLLFEKNAGTQLLPAPIGKEYGQQAERFYLSDPQMANYLQVRLQPIAGRESEKNNHSATKPVEIRLTLDAANGWQPVKTSSQFGGGH